MARQLEKGRPAAADKRRGAAPEIVPIELPKKRGKLKLIIIIVVALLVVLGGAGGAYFFLFAGSSPKGPKEAVPAQPFFVDVKPFVVTMKAADDSMHYVQLALSLKVPNEEAVAGATAVMPELLDMIRQTVLGFKIDELQTQDGVNKLRIAITTGTNRVLLQALGPKKIETLGAPNGNLVSNVFFQNLVIE
ncbi:MAG TPA: flagellar basal body-associated FliL family protein [Stellaceae bacterium]